MTFLRTPPESPTSTHEPSQADRDVPRDAGVNRDNASPASQAVLDELAALFLTGESVADTPMPAQPEALTRTTELLIAGHLPVRGSMWLVPFADAVSRQAGACSFIRLESDDECSIQLLRGQPVPEAALASSLQQAISMMAPQVDHWIVRPAPTPEPEQLLASHVDRITIFSSADDMAVVAAYTIIKDLASAAQDAEQQLPELALAVVGAEHHEALDMLQRINQTAQSFLDRPVELRLVLPRIDSGARCTQHINVRHVESATISDIVTWIHEPQSVKQPADAPTHARPTQQPSLRLRRDDDGDATTTVEPASHAPPASSAVTDDHTQHHAGPAKLAPKPSMQRDHTTARQTAESSDQTADDMQPLTCYVDSLHAIAPRCPDCDHIELAVDDEGTLHVLSRDTDLRDLRRVESWAMSHRALLAMACPDQPIDAAREVVCHVFTDVPASIADLHSAGLSLHVLAPVEVQGRRGWYYAPLN